MNNIKYQLASNSWNIEEHDAIKKVLLSEKLTMGSEVKKFEDQISEFHGVKHAIMVNSGSSANLIGASAMTYVRAKNFKPIAKRGVVIAPAVSWSTTYFPFIQLGYEIVLVDVDENFNISIAELEKYLDDRCVGIISVNLLGVSADNEKLQKICKERNLFLFEDNCESFGAKLSDKVCGSFGDVGTLSFFFSHHLQTMEGGMILTDCDNIANYARSLRAHGWVRDGNYDALIAESEMDEFDSLFKFILPGYCVRPLEMSGAVGQVQLKKWDQQCYHRQANAELFQARAKNASYLTWQKSIGSPTWFGFGCIFNDIDKNKRLDLFKYLKSVGIESRPIVAGNFANQPVCKSLGIVSAGDLKQANRIDNSGMFFGNDGIELSNQIDYLFDKLDTFFTDMN